MILKPLPTLKEYECERDTRDRRVDRRFLKFLSADMRLGYQSDRGRPSTNVNQHLKTTRVARNLCRSQRNDSDNRCQHFNNNRPSQEKKWQAEESLNKWFPQELSKT